MQLHAERAEARNPTLTPNPWDEYPLSFWENRPDLESPLFLSVAEWAKDHRDVIEVGCGIGKLRRAVKSQSYTGIDRSSKAIVEAHKAHPDDEWICGDFRLSCRDFTYGPSRFDASIACNVLDHLPHFVDGLAPLFAVSLNRVIVTFANVLCERQSINYRDDGCYNNTYRKQDVFDYADYSGWRVTSDRILNRYTDHQRLGSLVVFEPIR